MFEKIIFNVLALAFFTITFLKLIKKNDTSYIYILAIEFIGLTINFIELFFAVKLNMFFKILIYVFSIIIPGIIIWIEKYKKIDFPELFNVTLAKILTKFGKQEQAKTIISNFLNKNPNSYIAHKWLAEYYEEKENYEAAISEYMRVTDIKRNDFVSTYKLCSVLNKNKQNQEAIKLLEEILKQKPEYENATRLLGEILIENEMYKEAVNIYQDALKYHPTSYEFNYNLGIAYTMLNDFQNAKICYEKAAELNSLLYNAKYSLAEIELIYKELDEAEKYFMQALEDDELAADSYYELSKIAMVRGDKDKAINYANVAIDADSAKIVPKIKKDPIFIPIMARISIPFNLQNGIDNEEKKNKLKAKEIKAKEHLEDMFEITRNLSYDDIRLLNTNKSEKSGKKINIEEKEDNQKERQE